MTTFDDFSHTDVHLSLRADLFQHPRVGLYAEPPVREWQADMGGSLGKQTSRRRVFHHPSKSTLPVAIQ